MKYTIIAVIVIALGAGMWSMKSKYAVNKGDVNNVITNSSAILATGGQTNGSSQRWKPKQKESKGYITIGKPAPTLVQTEMSGETGVIVETIIE